MLCKMTQILLFVSLFSLISGEPTPQHFQIKEMEIEIKKKRKQKDKTTEEKCIAIGGCLSFKTAGL